VTTAGRLGAAAAARPTRAGLRRWARRLPLLLLPLAGLLVWQAVVWLAAPREWLLPSPGTVAEVLWTERERLWYHARATIRATLVGLGVALVAGLALAALIAASRAADRAVYPWVVASQAVPILALAPVMAVWLDYGTTQVAVAALMCVFPVVVTGVDGLRAADPRLVRTARALGASRGWTWWHVTLPAAMPPLLTGLRMAVVFAVSGAVVAEYVGADRGLGYLTQIATAQFETAVAFAAIALLGLLGVVLFLAVALLERLLLPHRHRPTRPPWRPTA
jgi:ABC-type nitrate/sulfonate/bicarbonate transport system permease component